MLLLRLVNLQLPLARLLPPPKFQFELRHQWVEIPIPTHSPKRNCETPRGIIRVRNESKIRNSWRIWTRTALSQKTRPKSEQLRNWGKRDAEEEKIYATVYATQLACTANIEIRKDPGEERHGRHSPQRRIRTDFNPCCSNQSLSTTPPHQRSVTTNPWILRSKIEREGVWRRCICIRQWRLRGISWLRWRTQSGGRRVCEGRTWRKARNMTQGSKVYQ